MKLNGDSNARLKKNELMSQAILFLMMKILDLKKAFRRPPL
jgi:hypothetical protein